MHDCPICGSACYCGGDIEDHDTGENEDCLHCPEERDADYPDDPPDDYTDIDDD